MASELLCTSEEPQSGSVYEQMGNRLHGRWEEEGTQDTAALNHQKGPLLSPPLLGLCLWIVLRTGSGEGRL